jgi:hypothetical protein
MLTSLGLAGTTIGSLALALSFVWTTVYTPEQRWTEEQAKEHQQASAKFHKLQHTVGGKANRKRPATSPEAGPTQAELDALDAARNHFQTTKAGLDAARTDGHTTALWLRYSGVAVAALGVVALAIDRKRSRKCPPKRDPFTYA